MPAGKPTGGPVKPFLIYYGWIPTSLVLRREFAERIAGYPLVVLGSGLEWSRNPDHGAARSLIHGVRGTRFVGYVDIGMTHGQPRHSLASVRTALTDWRAMGVQGILLDCAGPDYGVSSNRLRAVVAWAHRQHLTVLVNAFNPQAVLDVGLHSGDGWLAENWVISAGVPDAATEGFSWTALPLVRKRGIVIWMTATDNRAPGEKWVRQWVPKTVNRIHGSWIAVSGPQYSSTSNAIVPVAWIRQSLP